MNQDSRYWIEKLKLQPHPEGGYFREIYRDSEYISDLPERYMGERCFSTSIYYLLPSGQFSSFHRLKSDEIWNYYRGATLKLHILGDDHELTERILGPDPENGEEYQVVVKKGLWFAAECQSDGDYTLAGCTVAPGFEFDDFELADPEKLASEFPRHEKMIRRLTRKDEE